MKLQKQNYYANYGCSFVPCKKIFGIEKEFSAQHEESLLKSVHNFVIDANFKGNKKSLQAGSPYHALESVVLIRKLL